MPEQTLAALKKQRATNKCKLTNLVKWAKENHDHTDLCELTTRLRRVEKLMEEFTELEARIFMENPNEESDLTYEENYYNAASLLNKWIRSNSLNLGITNIDTSHNETQNNDPAKVKLPKIHIPSFSGDYSEWQSFFDMYTTTIHESPSLHAVQKFQYLKGLLRGEAALLLRHITVTESNYIGALNKLKERYDRKKHIISSFIRTFMEQPVIHNSTAASIKGLMDTSDEVIRGLQSLGEIGETRDPWLIYILQQKLDDKSKVLWAEHSADLVNPELQEFFKFLSRRIDTLESLTTPSKSKRLAPRQEVKGHVASEYMEAEIDSLSAIKSGYQCAMCHDKGHSIFQCQKFHALNATQRKDFAKQTKRCYNCLSSAHQIFRCTSKRRCQQCGKKHHTLLHTEEDTGVSPPATPPSLTKEVQSLHCQNTIRSGILPTAIVHVVHYSGRTSQCRALLDSGSQASFITEGCVQRLGLPKTNARISISGLGQSNSGLSKGLVTIKIRPELHPEFIIDALVMPKITSKLPPQNINVNMKSYAGIKLADPHYNKSEHIDLLIGADHFFNLLKDGQIKTNENESVLQNTIFGWIVSGQPGHSKESGLISMLAQSGQQNEVVNIDRSLQRFWELESITEPKDVLSPEELFCEEHFTKHLKRGAEGRFMVNLPFKKSPKLLGESLPTAIQRLRAMERRFSRDPSFAKMYHEFMLEYQQLNHMVEVPPPSATVNHFYLPHHGVFKMSNNKAKIRVVFDGSSKSSTGVSLNDCLAIGNTVQSNLYAIILRFREQRIAFSADVEKMYRQVMVSPDDTRFQRIVWRSDPSSLFVTSSYRPLRMDYHPLVF